MTIDEFTKLLDVLIWPLIILVSLYILRDRLPLILKFIERIKFKDLEIDLRKDIGEISKKAEGIELPKDMSSKEKLFDKEYYLMAGSSSRESIIGSWIDLEKLAIQVVQGHLDPEDGEAGNTTTPMFVRWALGTKDILDVTQLRIYDELKSVRNKIVHNELIAPSEAEALAYIDAVKKLSINLDRENR